jgi:flavin-dependent dehydrogenase
VSREPIDFLVVGGGPAGSAFAILAARSGASVVLVERDDYSRRRPGEHLAGRIRPLLDSLRVTKPADAGIAEPSVGIVSIWPGSWPPVLKRYRAEGDRAAIATMRHRFDEMMSDTARRAGATVLRCGRVASLRRDTRDGWRATVVDRDRLATEYATRSVVDASGRNAAVARQRGARRVNHGDLIAIVGWLDVAQGGEHVAAPLTVESCSLGWWSVSTMGEPVVIATLYTSARVMKSTGLAPAEFWHRALATTHRTRELASRRDVWRRDVRVFLASPSLASLVVGTGWISIGDAAVTLDPLGGQGVAFAMETAFRAFEAASIDPTWTALGETYRDALAERFARHLAGRAAVYAEAADVLSRPFLTSVAALD